jgi:hypothetical protein
MEKTIEIKLPEDVYLEAMKASEDSGQPLEELLTDAIRCALKWYRVDFHCPVKDTTKPDQQYNKETIDAMNEPINRDNKLSSEALRRTIGDANFSKLLRSI